MNRVIVIIFCSLYLLKDGFAQEEGIQLGNLVEPEFTIPPSAAFDMLGAFPAQIMTPTNIKDFKVDWSFQSWRLNPNLAIQAQPVWELLYNRPSLEKYRRASGFMRTLSTMDLSAGTLVDNENNRKVAIALKFNLYRQKDPLLDAKLFKQMDKEYKVQSNPFTRELVRANAKLDITKDKLKVDSIRQYIDSLEMELYLMEKQQKQKIQEELSSYQKVNWNTSSLEISGGRAYTFLEASAFDSLQLVGDAWLVWMSGGLGIGRTMLLSTLLRFSSIRNDALSDKEQIFTGGLNFRYGGWKYSFFSEVLFSSAKNVTVFQDQGINLSQLAQYSMALGGDWKISRNVVLSYGVRVNLHTDLKIQNIRPTAGLSCMMR